MDEEDAPVTIDADEDGVVGAVTAQMSERTSFIVLDQITSATAMLFTAQRIAAASAFWLMARTLPPNWPIRSADCSPIGGSAIFISSRVRRVARHCW